jgi:hypothetical protein
LQGVITPQGIHYRAKFVGNITQTEKPFTAIDTYQYHNGVMVYRIFRLRH